LALGDEARHRIAVLALGDEARHRIAVLARGDEAEPQSFYQPLRNGGDQPSQINTVDVDSNVRSHSDECNIETVETEGKVPQNDNTM
jgi:hypothetical protein